LDFIVYLLKNDFVFPSELFVANLKN